eukprot:1737873-Rhodomonas_salina.1
MTCGFDQVRLTDEIRLPLADNSASYPGPRHDTGNDYPGPGPLVATLMISQVQVGSDSFK